MNQHHCSLVLGLLFTVFALVTLLVWIPLDIETGVTETLRRRVEIGDAMAPTVITVGILIASIWLCLHSLFRLRAGHEPQDIGILSLENLWFMMAMLAVFVMGFALIQWTGPVVVKLINVTGADIGSYRQLRDTVPYKYAGFIVGGSAIIFGIISLVERRMSWRLAGVSIGAALVIAALFDLPFEDLLLPPNGDQ